MAKAKKAKQIPDCLASMGCLCWGHAFEGLKNADACDAREYTAEERRAMKRNRRRGH